MKILLDFDGVMITTPTWQKVDHLEDGFMAFNESCVENLARVLAITQADIVLTTTHRIHYNEKEWQQIFYTREIIADRISKVNQARTFTDLSIRCLEVLEWVTANPNENYVIIDDDKSLRDLPIEIKVRWVETQFHQGLTEECSKQALNILLSDD
ncbi:HAD domain-containing protein [Psychrobacter maritimus]|uniref:HAD domain-containing protein n=1 Tax=Psychrobacter maritimus TaxID=256325 RepID=UPI00263989A3|nr:HAD domain-containing protein [uncultured Psychrobacter sp.]